MSIRIGLVGYGVGGRLFHAPYIAASAECELVGVVARNATRISEVQRDLPGVPVRPDLGSLIDAGVDAVVITTPPATRRELVLEAVARGVGVVADKPFAPTADAGRELVSAAQDAGVLLNVFHNRRFDTDIVTAKGVLDSGVLGRISRLDLRCDQDDPSTLEAGPEGGLLRDLGSHVVDQALHLLGPAEAVTANLDWIELPEGRTDYGFAMTIRHRSGAHSHVSSSKINHVSSRELRAFGVNGSYVSDFRDVQFESLNAGGSPRDAGWGLEDEHRWGILATAEGRRSIPSHVGNYTDFYDAFAKAMVAGGPGPVPAEEGVAVLEVLDAARASDFSGVTTSV